MEEIAARIEGGKAILRHPLGVPQHTRWYVEDIPYLLERIRELEQDVAFHRKRGDEWRKALQDSSNSYVERQGKLEAENEKLHANLEKKEELLAEIRRGGEWFPDSGDVVERHIGEEGAAF